MTTTLTQANSQWQRRPVDERFSSIEVMHHAAVNFRTTAAVETIKANALRVAAEHGNLMLIGPDGGQALLNNWTFNQLSLRAKAPAAYLKTLPVKLAADCINTGLKDAGDAPLQLLVGDRLGVDGEVKTARAITSDKYSRIWNCDITSRLLELEARGPWQPAPAAFDGSRGLYLGDRDMFAFLVDNNRRIFEKGPGGGLSRGFFVSNSEVGDAAFDVTAFWYEYVCGNHRVWGAQGIEQVKVIHIGKDQGSKAFDRLQVEVRKYAEASTKDDEAKVLAARRFQLGATKDDVLDAIFKLKAPAITKTIANQAFELAETRVDWYGSPRSAWGYAGGLTEIARDLSHASDRSALEAAATKVMEIAF